MITTPSATPTLTMTPSPTRIVCGSGVTTGDYYYYDCCGNVVKGSSTKEAVVLDYSKPYNGISLLNIGISYPCPTPSSTQTPTVTPTYTPTPSITPTQTTTPTSTVTASPTPSKSAVYALKNDCEVFTLFDMGVTCNVIKNPSSPTSLDGILSLKVTGGTSPYSFYWANGQRTKTITGLPQGSFAVQVVDYYGDYTANTICTLFGPSQTPTQTQTPTPTLTPSPVWPNLCLTIIVANEIYGPFQFYPAGNLNGKPRWVSGSLSLEWYSRNQRWEVVGWTQTTGIPISTDTSNVPLASWTIVGGSGPKPQISMIQGICPVNTPLIIEVTTENSLCSGQVNCNGNITIQTQGGQNPYQYSIDNGVTFQFNNIFNGLCSGNYTVVVKDALGNVRNQVVTVGFDGSPVTYTIGAYLDIINLNGPDSQTAIWYVDVQPPLPLGTIIDFTLNVNTTQTIGGPGTGYCISETSVFNGNNLQTPSSNLINYENQNRPFCSPYTQDVYYTGLTYNLSATFNKPITGSSLSALYITNGQVGNNGCATQVNQVIEVSVSQATISNCNCCTVVVNPSPQGLNLTKTFGGQTNNNPLPKGNNGAPVYYPIILGLGMSQGQACSNFTEQITRYIDTLVFGTGTKIYQGTLPNPQLAVGYTYCTDGNGGVYQMSDGIVGEPTDLFCL